jgi:hypothetical protein
LWFKKCTSQFDAGLFATRNTLSYVSRWSIGRSALGIVLVLLVFVAAVPVHAAEVSIPIIGRYSTLVISLYIPPYPKWAHDVVLNASIAWNNAELWQNQNNNSAPVYTFVETNDGTATSTISFSMPQTYAGIAVAWTNYDFAPGSTTSIVGTQTFLDPSVFNQSKSGNVTAWRYAFRLALHELGRVQGLGSVLDGQDIMDPLCTPQQAKEAPKLSTLDLFALHILALGNSPQFVTLPARTQNQLTVATHFLHRTFTHSKTNTINNYERYSEPYGNTTLNSYTNTSEPDSVSFQTS